MKLGKGNGNGFAGDGKHGGIFSFASAGSGGNGSGGKVTAHRLRQCRQIGRAIERSGLFRPQRAL